jgi:iron complex transport system permease protein
LALLVCVLFAVSLMVGHTTYGPGEVLRVVLGESVPGASFTVGELRLPRAVLAVLVGCAFGMAGTSFQTLLRNQLASPEVIGISSGASAAAVYALVILSWNETAVSLLAIVAALSTALMIYVLAYRGGLVGTRLILIGIAVSAMLESVVAYVLMRAARWDLQVAMRWLTGSLNNATWAQVVPMVVAFALLAPVLILQSRDLAVMRYGADVARGLGVRVDRVQLVVVVAAVGLIAFATSAAGPIAFVAFLAGPIALRMVGPGGSLLIPAALVGAVLVLSADLVGQWAFSTRYPVGVVTGVLGAPYLIYLLIRSHRAGAAL